MLQILPLKYIVKQSRAICFDRKVNLAIDGRHVYASALKLTSLLTVKGHNAFSLQRSVGHAKNTEIICPTLLSKFNKD